MVACQFRAWMLAPAVEASVIVAAEQGTVAQGGAEATDDATGHGNDGLQVNPRAQAGTALDATKNRRQRIADAVNDVASGIGRNRFLQAYPAARLAGEIESEN